MSIRTDEIVWEPSEEVRKQSRLNEFMRRNGIEGYPELQERSTRDIGWFTARVLEFLDIEFSPPYQEVLDLSRGKAWPRWCVGGGLNAAARCLSRPPSLETTACIWESEGKEIRTLSYGALAEEVHRCARGMRRLGIGAGDSVGIHLSMGPETVIVLLATGWVGAIAVPLFTGFGTSAIANRLSDAGARLLFTVDAFPRRGKPIPSGRTALEAAERAPSVEHVVVINRTGVEMSMRAGQNIDWATFMDAGCSDGLEAEAEATLSNDPLLLLYSSGTTGRPKGILHDQCSFPIKAAQDMAFSMDVGPRTRICWLTDIGWMMGPWLIYGTLLLGGTMVLYDGAPDHPVVDRLWRLVNRYRIEVLGVSPTLIRSLMTYGGKPVESHDLSSLRIIGSTGETWNPEPWWWLFEEVGGRQVPIVNYSGGTEISGGILSGNPILPLKPCSFPAPCPGIAADVVDSEGNPVRGETGELVIREPWIGMARGFWKDPERYLETYWSRIPDTWVHGDSARLDRDGFWYILGRSDDTINVAGKRIGPAEVESILASHPDVTEAAVVGVEHEIKGTVMLGMCVLLDPDAQTDSLSSELVERVGQELGRPLRPKRVVFVPDLPRTRNGKTMRRVARASYLGEDPGDLSALVNPECLEPIRRVGMGDK